MMMSMRVETLTTEAVGVPLMVGLAGRVGVAFRVRECCREDLRLCAALLRGDRVMKGRREMPSGVAQVMSRVVLITGCSTGIGRAVMERLTVSGTRWWPPLDARSH